MDTKDKEPELTAPGVMLPDTGLVPPPPDLLDLAYGSAGTAVATLPAVQGGQKPQKSPTPLQDSLRRLRRDMRAMISIGVIVLFVLIAIVGPLIYQHSGGVYQSEQNGPVPASVYHTYSHEELIRQDEGPSAQYWLGTDDLGRDILARLMQGMLISITVALLVEVVDVVLGILVGVLAGFFGGWIDQFLARFTDLMFAFPGLLFVILLTGIFGPAADAALANVPVVGPNGNARLLLVSLALAFTIWPLMARYVRGQTLQLKEQQFIEAARTTGTSGPRVILRHIVPNLFSIVLLAFSFLGDWLRDAFDPRSKD